MGRKREGSLSRQRRRSARIRAGERLLLRQRLEASGRGFQPGTVDRVQRRAHGLRIRSRLHRGHAVERRRVDLPGPTGVQPGHFGDGRPAQLVRCARRERRQRGEGVRQRRLAERRPDPAASCAMHLLERDDLLARSARRFVSELQKGSPQGRFLPFVVLGPGRRLREQIVALIVRHGLAQVLRHSGIPRRRLRETPPDRLPCPFPPAEPFRRDDPAVLLRIEPEVRLAAGREGAPATGLPTGPHRFGIAHPGQHVPHRIVGEEPVEVLRFEAPAP